MFKALGQGDRLRVLATFAASKESSPKLVADALGIPLGNVSYHTRTLVDAGLLDLTGTTPRRGALEHHYALSDLGRKALKAAQRLDRDLNR